MITVDPSLLCNAPTPDPAALAAMEEVAPLLIARRPEYDDAQLAALRVAVDARRRAGISWNRDKDSGPTTPDLTGGKWPTMCDARWRDLRPGWALTFAYTCTRPASHTGRHAAGNGVRVVAVWAGDLS